MVQLSVVILTLNEEVNIKRTLESLDGVADEVLIVDSLSTDRTVEIAQEMGAKVILNKYEGQIEQLQLANSQATYDHLLNVDADEVLSGRLKESILELKKNWTYTGYSVRRSTFYCGSWIEFGSASREFRLRLIDRRKAQVGGMNPHSKYIIDKGDEGPLLVGPLLHFRFQKISEHVAQINFQSSAAAQAAFEAGKGASVLRILTKPAWIFFRDYFMRLGFLEGRRGLAMCTISSLEFFLRWLKVWELKHVKQPDGKP